MLIVGFSTYVAFNLLMHQLLLPVQWTVRQSGEVFDGQQSESHSWEFFAVENRVLYGDPVSI